MDKRFAVGAIAAIALCAACGRSGPAGEAGPSGSPESRPPVAPTAALRLETVGAGQGTIHLDAPSLACADQCSAQVPRGDAVLLTAVAAPGSRFVEWLGACRGKGSCAPMVDREIRVRAWFEKETAPSSCVPGPASAFFSAGIQGSSLCRGDGWCWETAPVGGTLTAIWVNADNDVWAVGNSAVHFNGSSWSMTPLPEGTGELVSIWGSGPSDVWAVGRKAAVHWNGRAWASVSLPPGTEILHNVSGTGPGDVWIGAYSGGGGLSLRWDGTAWRTATAPTDLGKIFALGPTDAIAVQPGGACHRLAGGSWVEDSCGDVPRPTSVWGSAPDDVWVFGGISSEAPGGTHYYRAHWDGAAWTREEVEPGLEAAGLYGLAKDDVWLGAHHFDGMSWSLVGTPHSYFPQAGVAGGKLWGVWNSSVMSSRDGARWSFETGTIAAGIVGVGAIRGEGFWTVGSEGMVASYDGNCWRSVEASAGLALLGAFGSSASDIWGTEYIQGVGGVRHWDGVAWSPRLGPALGQIAGWSNGPTDAWIISRGEAPGSRTFHWDGRTWSLQSENTDTDLFGIWASGPADAWAAGARRTVRGRQALIRHWDGKAWSDAYAGREFAVLSWGGYAFGITGAFAGDVWASASIVRDGASVDQLLRWNGRTFDVVLETTQGIGAIAVSAPDDVWLLGPSLHFDGRTWTPSAALPLSRGPGGLLMAGVPAFGSVRISYEGSVYLRRHPGRSP